LWSPLKPSQIWIFSFTARGARSFLGLAQRSLGFLLLALSLKGLFSIAFCKCCGSSCDGDLLRLYGKTRLLKFYATLMHQGYSVGPRRLARRPSNRRPRPRPFASCGSVVSMTAAGHSSRNMRWTLLTYSKRYFHTVGLVEQSRRKGNKHGSLIAHDHIQLTTFLQIT
jgi:hypothetical protein